MQLRHGDIGPEGDRTRAAGAGAAPGRQGVAAIEAVREEAARRAAAHLQAARFFFANGYAAEALGYLRIAAAEEPSMVDTGPFRALRGACHLLMGHWDLAQADLDNPLVKDDTESQFWRAAAHAATSDTPGTESKTLAIGLALLK